MKKAILFSDIDGTLTKDRTIPLHYLNFEKMQQLRNDGHIIALCTGKHKVDLLQVLTYIDIPFDYLILCNGATILDQNFSTIYQKLIPKEIGDCFIKDCIKKNRTFYFSDIDKLYGFCDGQLECIGISDSIINKSVEEVMKEIDSYSIMGYHNTEFNEEENTEFLNTSLLPFKEELDWSLNINFVDIVAKGCSKGEGIKKLIEFIPDNIKNLFCRRFL